MFVCADRGRLLDREMRHRDKRRRHRCRGLADGQDMQRPRRHDLIDLTVGERAIDDTASAHRVYAGADDRE